MDDIHTPDTWVVNVMYHAIVSVHTNIWTSSLFMRLSNHMKFYFLMLVGNFYMNMCDFLSL